MKKFDSKNRIASRFNPKMLLSGLLLAGAIQANATNISITGTVFNDANGGTITGNPISSVFNNPLYIYAIDNSGNVVNKTLVRSTVDSNGTYTLTVTANVNYNITLSSANVNIGASNPVLGLPSAYVATAEGTSAGGDGTADYGVAINSGSNLVINYGIDARPQGASYTVTSPSYNAQGRVIIPASAFNASDLEDGTYTTGFAGRSVDLFQATGGTLYYNNNPITFTSASVANRINGFNVNLLTLAPGPNASSGLGFAYSTVDNAGVPELVPNTISVGNPLPVGLDKFTGVRQGATTDLSWITASETGNDHFEIERSGDGKTFSKAGTVQSAAPNGISAKVLYYHFEDALPTSLQGSSIYYRLRQVDFSSKSSYSGTIRLTVSGKGDFAVNTYPNPASGTLNIQLVNAAASFQLSMANASGQVVYTKSFEDVKGTLLTGLDMQNFPAGQYYIQYKANSSVYTQKIMLVH